jgi:hypothetical protein
LYVLRWLPFCRTLYTCNMLSGVAQ